MSDQEACAPSLQFQQAHNLLGHPLVRDDLHKRKTLRTLTAQRHNIFVALGVSRKENYHSRLIGYLLDPTAQHDQGTAFLAPFLEKLELTDVTQSVLANTRVMVEKDTAGHGRIDLVITLGDSTTIAIENKVDAWEQPEQLARYWRWLDSLNISEEKRFLIFLTPDGREGTTAISRDRSVRMSYAELASVLHDGLASCPGTAIPLHSTIRQYIQLCENIALPGDHDVIPLNKDIIDFLKTPERLAAALNIRDHLQGRVITDIRDEFKKKLVSALQKKLDETQEATLWQAGFSQEYGSNQLIGLIPKVDQIDPSWRGYRCIVDMPFTKKTAIGWRRPEQNHGTCTTTAIEQAMRATGFDERYFSESSWYIMFTSIDDVELWEILCQSDTTESILKMHEDNQHGSRLAEQLAALIWSYFKPYFKDIEALPDFHHRPAVA